MPTASAPNKLHALLGHYNSDEEESETEADDQFKDFMNEIKATETETSAEASGFILYLHVYNMCLYLFITYIFIFCYDFN